MSETNLAFPGSHNFSTSPGMSLRDYFAAKAMLGDVIASSQGQAPVNPKILAKWSYEMADAMLEARENKVSADKPATPNQVAPLENKKKECRS
jgi:hypothetical protein